MSYTAGYAVDMAVEYFIHNHKPSMQTIKDWIPIKYKHEDWQELIKNPIALLEALKKAGATIEHLKQRGDDGIGYDYKEEILSLPPIDYCNIEGITQVGLKQINKEHHQSACTIAGKVVGISDVEPISTRDLYECQTCGATVASPAAKCCSEKNLKISYDPAAMEDRQVVKIQESHYTSMPAKFTIECLGADMLWKVRQGKEIKAVGIIELKPYKMRGEIKFLRYLKAYHIQQVEQELDVRLTDKDHEWIRNEIEQPYFWDKFVNSYAPHITGFREIKEALILAHLSTVEDSPLNILLAGDASVAKSLFLLYAASMDSNGHYISFAGAKWPSLGAFAQRDEDLGSWIILPGLFPLADRGMACGDEMHAIEEDVARNLNEPGEQKTVSYAKGGQVGVLPARCAWVMACNSYYGDWKESADIQDNLQFLGKGREALISRFPLIFIVRDVIHAANDKRIAMQILKNRNNGGIKQFLEDWKDGDTEYYGFYSLKKLITYLKDQPLPLVPIEKFDDLATWYSNERLGEKDLMHKKTKPRNFDKGVLIAQLKAKALCKNNVDQTDIDYAMSLLNASRDSAAFDPTTGRCDYGEIEGQKPQRVIDEELSMDEQFMKAVNSAIEMNAKRGEGEYFTLEQLDIALRMQGRTGANPWTELKIEQYMKRHAQRFWNKYGQGKYSKL